MAKINLKKHLLRNLNGEPMFPNKLENGILVEDKSKEPFTISDIIASNLTSEDTKVTPEQRFEYFRLALKIKEASGDIELTVEELATIKKKIGENPMPLVVGRVWEVLENLMQIPEPKKSEK